ncbi:MAG: leucine-rich repeat domain-containing protein, partial [Prevotella sp.]
HISNVNLIVPEHLVTSYKLDSYWYNFKSIQGFNTEEIQYWRINNPLVLNRERFAGNPDIVIVGNYDRMPSLKINGDNQQNINNLYCFGNSKDYNSYAGQILCNSKNVVINGKVNIDLETQDKRWHFFCLPYDIKVSEITSGDPTTQKAIRYYNGANRAQNGVAGSWKNFGEDDVIPAGTGFIMQTNKFAWSRLYSFNETKQNIVATTEFVKTLEVNDSETAANKGWNLVGNPWQCFFNNHYLNFNGPITVWDTYNRTYKAYSLTDDDYAIRPNEAFFVQCPNEEYNTISFPAEGRQLTAEIVNQNPAQVVMRERTAKGNMRKLVDVVISDGDHNDQTRVVLNENASADYELSCDASKMMSMDQEVPQIYTLDNGGIQYSINERPVSDGVINLGFYAGKSGKYTFKLSRSMVETVILVDHMTGKETDIRNSEYTFTSEAGTDNARFSLKFNPAETTGIKTVQSETSDDIMYNLSGQRISKPVKGIMIRGGKKIIIK